MIIQLNTYQEDKKKHGFCIQIGCNNYHLPNRNICEYHRKLRRRELESKYNKIVVPLWHEGSKIFTRSEVINILKIQREITNQVLVNSLDENLANEVLNKIEYPKI